MDKLIKIRKEKNLKLKDMAKILNITTTHYYLIETSQRKLYYGMAVKIAHIFNKKPDDLFFK